MDIRNLKGVDEYIESSLELSFKADIKKRLTFLKLTMKSYMVNYEYASKLYELDADELYNGYMASEYCYVSESVEKKVSNRSRVDKERYREYLLLFIALECLNRKKCHDALSLYKRASLCNTQLTPTQIREQNDKLIVASLASEIWKRDNSKILLPAHVIKLVIRITKIERSDKTMRRWLDDEIAIPIEILEKIDSNSMPRGKAINKQRELTTNLIYDELKDHSNHV